MRTFLDINIVMYAAGEAHPHKEPSAHFLRRVAHGELDVLTDSEALQEILYRYWRLKRMAQGTVLVAEVVRLVPTILPVDKADALLASTLLTQHAQIEPRDAIHAAVMLNHSLTEIYSYDTHFDAIPGLKRRQP